MCYNKYNKNLGLLVLEIPARSFMLNQKEKGWESKMFKTGDYIVYGHCGICKVMGTTTLEIEGIPKNRLYYVLSQDGKTDGKIFTPVNNEKTVMRKILTEEEAEQLIDRIPNVKILDINDDRQREEKYKECIRSCECIELVRIIKTVYVRKQARMKQGKKITSVDEHYLKMAEENLYSELSVLLGIPKSKMEAYITSRIEK